MSSEQDETFAPRNLAVLGGLLFFALFLGEAVFPREGGIFSGTDVSENIGTQEDVAMRIQPVVSLDNLTSHINTASADGVDLTPKQLYAGACLACHASGVANAPKLGDAEAWKLRMANGMDALVDSAIAGKGAMPPNGGSAYSPEQIRQVVEYILVESGL